MLLRNSFVLVSYCADIACCWQAFFELYCDLCEPSYYKPMLHDDHVDDFKHFRAKSKSWNGDKHRQKNPPKTRFRHMRSCRKLPWFSNCSHHHLCTVLPCFFPEISILILRFSVTADVTFFVPVFVHWCNRTWVESRGSQDQDEAFSFKDIIQDLPPYKTASWD